MNADAQKRAAAARAVEFVRSGMRLGLGTGSTAKHFVELIGERVRSGLDVVAVPTSEATFADAKRCGIPLTTLDETPALDLTVDSSLLWAGAALAVVAAVLLAFVPRLPSAGTSRGLGRGSGSPRITGSTTRRLRSVGPRGRQRPRT